MCILTKATEVTNDVWQWSMRCCGDKRSVYNGENKTKEDKLLEDVSQHNRWSVLFIYYKWWSKHCVILPSSCSILEFSKILQFVNIYPATWGRGWGELTNGGMGGGGLKSAIFPVMSFLNDAWGYNNVWNQTKMMQLVKLKWKGLELIKYFTS